MMKFIQKLQKLISHPRWAITTILCRYFYLFLSDRVFVQLLYYRKFGKFVNLDNPQTFNEKLQWLKLYYHIPRFTIMVDKVKGKDYVASKIGAEYIIPTLAVYNDACEIDFDKLPDQFVLKCNHNSGGMCICKDKSKIDHQDVRKSLNKCLRVDYSRFNREWPYKNVPRKIIAEKYMVDESGTELKDYKIFCMDGEPQLIQVDFGRFTNHKRNIYDCNWNLLPVEIEYPSDAQHIIPKPDKLGEMLQLAKTLSQGIPHVRVDFYYINGQIYWGELTFFHGSGTEKFVPEEWDLKLGRKITLPPPIY